MTDANMLVQFEGSAGSKSLFEGPLQTGTLAQQAGNLQIRDLLELLAREARGIHMCIASWSPPNEIVVEFFQSTTVSRTKFTSCKLSSSKRLMSAINSFSSGVSCTACFTTSAFCCIAICVRHFL